MATSYLCTPVPQEGFPQSPAFPFLFLRGAQWKPVGKLVRAQAPLASGIPSSFGMTHELHLAFGSCLKLKFTSSSPLGPAGTLQPGSTSGGTTSPSSPPETPPLGNSSSAALGTQLSDGFRRNCDCAAGQTAVTSVAFYVLHESDVSTDCTSNQDLIPFTAAGQPYLSPWCNHLFILLNEYFILYPCSCKFTLGWRICFPFRWQNWQSNYDTDLPACVCTLPSLLLQDEQLLILAENTPWFVHQIQSSVICSRMPLRYFFFYHFSFLFFYHQLSFSASNSHLCSLLNFPRYTI